jgi:hypothetical protein
MPFVTFARTAFAGVLAASLAACGAEETSNSSIPAADAGAPAAFPANLPVIGDGYPSSGDACRRLGESDATVDWLDDSAVLVGCPTKEAARALGGRMVGIIEGITLVSVPMGDANVGMTDIARMESPPKDIIRGKGGLEEKCHARLAAEGMDVIGTNRIEESEAAIAIYVNINGAEAPWRCLGYKNGTIGEIMYTGSEGGA